MQTPEFERGLAKLIGMTAADTVAIMCAEAVPWRCHRSLIADALAARDIPVLIAPNTSVGVSVVVGLVSRASQGLGPSYDVEIFEAHHHTKRDAPSGTALALGEAVARARGVPLN